MNLLQGLEDKGYCVVMDNFFTSILLFRDLARKAIYATGTIRSNRIDIPTHLKNTRAWKMCAQGHLEWAMHGTRGVEGQMPGFTHLYSCIANWVPLRARGHYATAEWCG
jgi:hypothetical protein